LVNRFLWMMADSVDHEISQSCTRLTLAGKSVTGETLITRSCVPVDGTVHECVCPYCRREILARATIVEDGVPARPRRLPPKRAQHPKGFVALIYGSAPAYFIGALVTGWSLQKHTSLPIECRVLLVTHDVPEAFRSMLSSVWTLQDVEYIEKASPWFYWDYHKSRFKQVFTKLRILQDLHGLFSKVILLDLDLLIRGEVDSLFDLPAPAAMVRGQGALRHGETVPIDSFFMGHRQVIGINCGVMLVEPNESVFNHMIKEVETYSHPEHWPSHGPEQDYLSRFYNAFGYWTNISCRYNYQVHLNQFGSLEWHHYNIRDHPEVSIFHFSGRLVKPWSLLLDLKIAHSLTYDALNLFVRNVANKAAAELVRVNEALNQPVSETSKPTTIERDTSEEPSDEIDSHFCYGTGINQKKARRCYLDRYIHPSWTEADSQSCIEWINAFRELNQSLNGQITALLEDMWSKESSSR
jgi:lipopolysaccharide biosynthesis glycosyltransferase